MANDNKGLTPMMSTVFRDEIETSRSAAALPLR